MNDRPRARLRWSPAIGYVLIVVVFGFLIWQNHTLTSSVAVLNERQADQGYRECLARNTRATESIKAFTSLVAAHKADGSIHAAQVWRGYLDITRRTPLPPCVKPTAPPARR